MTVYQETQLKSLVKKTLSKNDVILNEYRKGKKGYIGFFMNKVIKDSILSFHSKDNKQKLVELLKTELNQ